MNVDFSIVAYTIMPGIMRCSEKVSANFTIFEHRQTKVQSVCFLCQNVQIYAPLCAYVLLPYFTMTDFASLYDSNNNRFGCSSVHIAICKILAYASLCY